MDRTHEEIVLEYLVLVSSMLHQVPDDRHQDLLERLFHDVPMISICPCSECGRPEVAVEHIRDDDTGDPGILDTDLPEGLDCGRITRMQREKDDIVFLSGQCIRESGRIRQQGDGKVSAALRPAEEIPAAGTIHQERPDHR